MGTANGSPHVFSSTWHYYPLFVIVDLLGPSFCATEVVRRLIQRHERRWQQHKVWLVTFACADLPSSASLARNVDDPRVLRVLFGMCPCVYFEKLDHWFRCRSEQRDGDALAPPASARVECDGRWDGMDRGMERMGMFHCPWHCGGVCEFRTVWSEHFSSKRLSWPRRNTPSSIQLSPNSVPLDPPPKKQT